MVGVEVEIAAVHVRDEDGVFVPRRGDEYHLAICWLLTPWEAAVRKALIVLASLAVGLAGVGLAPAASATTGDITFTNKTTTNGLGNNFVYGVHAAGSTVYAATSGGGLSISTNGGTSFTNTTTTNKSLRNFRAISFRQVFKSISRIMDYIFLHNFFIKVSHIRIKLSRHLYFNKRKKNINY
jgi:hypothetical protein